MAAVVAALLTSACSNMVYSERALFSKAGGAPGFRAGVWMTPEAGCEADVRQPLRSWPECMHGAVLGRRGPIMSAEGVRMMLVAGEPLIIQEEWRSSDGTAFFYGALRPTEFDAHGRVVASEAWPVQCGPPPLDDGKKRTEGGLTEHPLPGLKVDGDNCKADDPAVVRAAAAQSRAWADDISVSRWVRDGRR
jgi:hypothetical protein